MIGGVIGAMVAAPITVYLTILIEQRARVAEIKKPPAVLHDLDGIEKRLKMVYLIEDLRENPQPVEYCSCSDERVPVGAVPPPPLPQLTKRENDDASPQ